MWGDAEWCRRRDEREAYEQAHKAKLEDQAAEVRAILRKAETDVETWQMLELARLIGPDGWNSRANTLESIERRRAGPRANDSREVQQLAQLSTSADLALRYSIAQARRAIALMRSWGDA